MGTAKNILQEYWGYDSFRPLQEDIINAVIAGDDVLALLPTGGGKSLCYQVPVMMKEGIGLVISPLIALMKDQVEGLRRKGITAFAIYSGMSRKDLIRTLQIASNSNCKFLYVSPERLETRIFQEYLPGLNVNLIAVDEAHCISQWGYDFRPSYLKISAIREELSKVPVLALTASATKNVQQDICEKLQPGSSVSKTNWQVFRQSFERANLSYSAFNIDSKINKIIEVIEKVPGASIVYCRSRRKTKDIAELLKLHGISASFYHAGLNPDERSERQEGWINNKVRVIACTNAFGMGIDKPDVRTVLHADVPDCLENYYQEAGRAGRDGKKSYAVLVYDQRELDELKTLADIRYPGLDEIRKTYQAIANFLQIPAGGGAGEYYDFDINGFIKKFELPPTLVINCLKVLEQEGWLSFNEQVFLPSFVGFTCNKERLYQFEIDQVQFEPLIKTLLRSYEGIFDQPVAISERMIASLLKTDIEQVQEKLNLLHRSGIIEYRAQKDKPQVLLLQNRIKSSELSIDAVQYKKRKLLFQKRVDAQIDFVTEKSLCRSQMIGKYFGDDNIKECGVCDNCLNKKKSNPISKTDFEKFRAHIVSTLAEKPLPAKELTSGIKGLKQENAWKILTFMQDEQIISLTENGMVRLNKK